MTDNPRPPANTLHARAIEEASEENQGRWKKNTEVSIAGTGPIPHGSVLAGPQWSQDCVPPEPSLGFEIDALPSMLTVSGLPPEEPLPPDEDEQTTEEPEQ